MPFHHDPTHDDDTLDAVFAALPDQPFTVLPAREGAVLELMATTGG